MLTVFVVVDFVYLFFGRQFVLDVKQRVDTVINNQARAPTAQVQSVGYDTQSLVNEMRDGLNQIKSGVSQVSYFIYV